MKQKSSIQSMFSGLAWFFFVIGFSTLLIQGASGAVKSEGNLDQEIQELESAQAHDPDNLIIKGKLARAYQKKSEQLVETGDLNTALQFLERIGTLEGKQPAALLGASPEDLFRQGIEALSGKQLHRAREFFDRALEQDPESAELRKAIGVSLHNAGIEKVQEGRIDEGFSYLESSLRYYGEIQNTWELLGDIAYQQQHLGDARKYWERAFSMQPRAELQQKLIKLNQEAPVELDLAHYGSSHFIIRFKRSDETYQGYQLKQILEEAFRKIGRDFNLYPDMKIPVILYTEEEFRQVTGSPHWSSAVFDGKIRLPVYAEGKMNVSEFERLVYHELTHAFVYELSANRCPVWLNEGLAEYEENKIQRVDMRVFEGQRQTGSLFEFSVMDAGLTDQAPIEMAQLFYQQAFSMTNFMIDRYRLFKIKEILVLLKLGSSFEEALRKKTGLSYEKFETTWRTSVMRN